MKFFKNNSSAKNTIVIFSFALFLSLSFANTSEASVTYDGAKIVISNSAESIKTVNQSLNDASLLEQTAPNEWLLKVPLHVESTGSLTIDGADVAWLKLHSQINQKTAYIEARGNITILNSKITSWNSYKNAPEDAGNMRGYVLVKKGNAIISSSTFSYLGYSDDNASSYSNGLISGVAIESGAGSIDASLFSNNIYGLYMVSTNNFSIAKTIFSNNGDSGVNIFSSSDIHIADSAAINNFNRGFMIYRTTNSVIDNSEAYGNSFDENKDGNDAGFFVGGKSSNIIVKNSNSHDNANAGFYLCDISNSDFNNLISYNNGVQGIGISCIASGNSISNISSYSNGMGVHIYGAALDNLITGISTYNNLNYGFLIGEWTAKTRIKNAKVMNNGRGGLLLTTLTRDNAFYNIETYGNKYYGFSFTANAVNSNIFDSNTYSNGYGVFSETMSANTNYFYGLTNNNNSANISITSGNINIQNVLNNSEYSINNPNISVERYGSFDKDNLYYVLKNNGLTAQSGILTVDFSKFGISSIELNSIKVTEIISEKSPSFNLNGLNISFNVTVNPSDGLVFKIANLNIPTVDLTPPAKIFDLSTSSPTSSSVTLSWSASGNSGIDGIAAGYDVRFSTQPITETNWHVIFQAISEPLPLSYNSKQSFVINGLLPNTTYYFGIKSYDEALNWSYLSNIVSVKTLNEFSPADLNQDGIVNSVDFGILMSYWNSASRPKADLNQDGIVNSVDFGIMMSKWGA